MRHRAIFPAAILAGGLLTAAAPEVQAQTTAPGAPPLTYAQPLSPAAVQSVQDRLRQSGAYSGAVDGVWGPDSQSALERYQQSRGLQVTGQLNQATAATLGLSVPTLLSTTAPAPQPAPGPSFDTLRPSAVRLIQGRLRALGFYSGAVDGIWGGGTQSAIQRFQQGRGLQPTGQVNGATLTAMGLDPNGIAAMN